MLPSPFDPSPTEEQLSMSLHEHAVSQGDYDWATFISAYSQGRWDPLKTPHPPRSHLSHPSHPQATLPTTPILDAPGISDSPELTVDGGLWKTRVSNTEMLSPQDTLNPAGSSMDLQVLAGPAPSQSQISSSLPATSGPMLPDTGIAARRSIPLQLGFSHRARNSFADIRSAHANTPELSRHGALNNVDITASAAAMRLAAARVSIAPLALPSPEHELTDPMRGATAVIPGSHPPDFFSQDNLLPKSPNARKSRLSSFWQGTQDVEDKRLSTIEGSPPMAVEERVAAAKSEAPRPHIPFVAPSIPPATAPVRVSDNKDDDDYFGAESQGIFDNLSATSSEAPSVSASVSRPEHEVSRQLSAPPFSTNPATVPAQPRRICLTRQTSAPLPTLTLYERRLRTSRPPSESSAMSRASRSAKEEQMYSELGYLAPPNPPDELERRRAMYR